MKRLTRLERISQGHKVFEVIASCIDEYREALANGNRRDTSNDRARFIVAALEREGFKILRKRGVS